MRLLIFRTNIENIYKIRELEQQFSSSPGISSWTIDVEDIDKVLKVHTKNSSSQAEVQSIVHNCGFLCEELS